jgi:DNA helicase HerA-like ATPase
MEEILELPATSTLELSRIWETLRESGRLSLYHLKQEILRSRINDHVKDALIRRIEMLSSAGIISDNETTQIDEIFNKNQGSAVIILLRGMPSLHRKVVVGLILKKMMSLLDNFCIEPTFLFAEEAHLYQNLSFWEDLVTRMRHIGISPIFITNEPEAFSDFIYRQADNMFIFSFLNDHDLNILSKFSKLDAESLISIVKSLPMGRALSVGNITGGIPAIFDISKQRFFRYGETRKAFRQFNRAQEKNLILPKLARDPNSAHILRS